MTGYASAQYSAAAYMEACIELAKVFQLGLGSCLSMC